MVPAETIAAPADALVRAYLEQRPALVRAFAAKLRSREAAEDVVQELFVHVQRAAGEEVRDPRAWLFRVGMNILLDSRRSAARSAAREERWAVEAGEPEAEVHAGQPSPERAVASREVLQRALRAVDGMPPRMAEAFRLNRLQGLTQPQVAERMGVSVKAVEKHLAGALERLVIELKGLWP